MIIGRVSAEVKEISVPSGMDLWLPWYSVPGISAEGTES